MGKKFRGPFSFSEIKRFWKKRKKVTVKVKSTSGKKICTIRFTTEEFDTILTASESQKQTVEQFFKTIIEDLVKNEQRKTYLR
jgi:hypothetical protein